jgi:di/tricarboxylate transporter
MPLALALGLVFAAIVTLGALRPRWHMGLVAIAASSVFAALVPGAASASTLPLRFFPAPLFMKLVGVTLFFGALERNGTFERLLGRALHTLRGRPELVPVVFFVAPAALVTGGVGNIAAVALLAPIALRSAAALGIPAVAMSVLVVGAANAAAFSPLSLAGVIVAEAVATRANELGLAAGAGLRWSFFARTFALQAIVCALGFAALGGAKAVRRARAEAGQGVGAGVAVPGDDESGPTDEPVSPPSLDGAQRRSVAAFVVFVACTVFFGSRFAAASLPAPLCATFGDPGALGFVGVAALMLLGDASVDDVVRHAPWSAIFLVCGMMTFLEWSSSLGALDALTARALGVASERTLPFGLAFAAALLSAVSSSTGVVLPLVLPMLPELHEHVPSVPVLTMLTSIGVGAHLVDASPLSTLGALCVSNAGDAVEQERLFRALLLWGFAMVPLAAVLCAAVGAF